jgi:hypothetical protein
MASLLPLSNVQKQTMDKIRQLPIEDIPFDVINTALKNVTKFPELSDVHLLLDVLQEGGNGIYNYVLQALQGAAYTNTGDIVIENNDVDKYVLMHIMENTTKTVDRPQFRYVWFCSNSLDVVSVGDDWCDDLDLCMATGQQAEPCIDSNDGVGGASVVLSVECRLTDEEIETEDGFKEVDINGHCKLRKAPWYIYSSPAIYHYMVFCEGCMVDLFTSICGDLKTVRDRNRLTLCHALRTG